MNLTIRKCILFEIGVSYIIRQNVISERFPSSLNQETREVSNVCHGPL